MLGHDKLCSCIIRDACAYEDMFLHKVACECISRDAHAPTVSFLTGHVTKAKVELHNGLGVAVCNTNLLFRVKRFWGRSGPGTRLHFR